MNGTVFGIDFGTTNSLASVVKGERMTSLVNEDTDRPHPSVIWYRGAETVVGQAARENLDLTEAGAPPGFVRSPKMLLRREGPIFVDGRPIEATDVVAEVLRHIKSDAAQSREGVPGHNLSQAIMTIPVDFGGPERRALRQAANKSGIGVVQFVHEPVAALYAYFRSKENMAQELARLEGRSVLVFDWGGGTLDLTLCRIQGGSIMQAINLGDNDVGGDQFDERLRNLLRSKHAKAHGVEDITALEQPGMPAKLLHQCELAKIAFSNRDAEDALIYIRNYLRADGSLGILDESITREELDQQSVQFITRGLARIDEILDQSRLTYQDIDLCLATGGMVNMPAIRDGLAERFLGRVPRLENGDRIISEGAAWIANDGLRLTLSKPIEILVADTSGHGTYYPLVDSGWHLPLENETQIVTNTRLFCTDPREGVAVVEIAKPAKLGRVLPDDPRRSLCVTRVKVDAKAQPLLERIECHLQIDHDYVARVTLRSTGQGDESVQEFHDLEFGLSLIQQASPQDQDENNNHSKRGSKPGKLTATGTSNLAQRANIVASEAVSGEARFWMTVPGDLVDKWKPTYFDKQSTKPTARQMEERNFYVPCAICMRSITQIKKEGPISLCTSLCGLGPHRTSTANTSNTQERHHE
jgi:molecular chaperone DnaK